MRAEVHGVDEPVRLGPREGDGDGAAACADVRDLQGAVFVFGGGFQRQFHQQFGFRAGNQYTGIDRKLEVHEARVSQQISDRFALAAALEKPLELADFPVAEGAFGMGVQCAPSDAKHVGEQAFAINSGVVRRSWRLSGACERIGYRGHRLAT